MLVSGSPKPSSVGGGVGIFVLCGNEHAILNKRYKFSLNRLIHITRKNVGESNCQEGIQRSETSAVDVGEFVYVTFFTIFGMNFHDLRSM